MQQLRFRALRLGEQFLQSPWALVLVPLSWLWRLGFWWKKVFTSPFQASRPVISIGNIALGGTGKTPLVILLAKQFPHRRVAILARGYGAFSSELNDEMKVIQRQIPHARLYQGVDRVSLAKRAIREGAELILLDDGFQYRRLVRDFDLVIVRPEDFTAWVFPCGFLREPPSSLQRATLLFSYASIPNTIALQIQVRRIVDQSGDEVLSIAGEKVAVFCGIGNPGRFTNTVKALGAEVVLTLYLGDHEPVQNDQLLIFYERCKCLHVKYLVCTEKDFVKLKVRSLPVLCIEVESVLARDSEKWRNMIEKIEEKLNNNSTGNLS